MMIYGIHHPTISLSLVRMSSLMIKTPTPDFREVQVGFYPTCRLSDGSTCRIMQRGFDTGYPLGVGVGLRVGNVLGVLEGVIAALTSSKGKGKQLGKASRGAKTGSSSSAGGGPEVAVGQDADGTGAEQAGDARSQEEGLRYVRTLYDRAHTELKISELLKGLDDGKIAAIPDAADPNGNDANLNGKEGTSKDIHLPEEIENVLGRWERLVLGSLGKERSDNQIFTHVGKGKIVEVESRPGS
jgi:hypothetical protein